MRVNEFLDCVQSAQHKNGSPTVIGHHNLHSLYLQLRDQGIQTFYERADFTIVDGMSLVLIGRLFGLRIPPACRIVCLDYFSQLMNLAAAQGWSVFILGGVPGVVEQGWAGRTLSTSAVKFHHRHGYFDANPDSVENREVVARIRREAPDLLLVGMGMPRQEHWILNNIEGLNARVVLTIGGCLDYGAGGTPPPPRWLGRLGLEWLFRLVQEPRRLAGRYLVEPWSVAWEVCKHLYRGRGKISARNRAHLDDREDPH
jgi:N-acetylglucosaminyldiphosphoundecaprenol N-acetyl-beta-D-mannosaminyltransferase